MPVAPCATVLEGNEVTNNSSAPRHQVAAQERQSWPGHVIRADCRPGVLAWHSYCCAVGSQKKKAHSPVDIGVFIPINNNGWIISAASPQYMPSFELNKQIVLKSERYGLDFALSMIKLHGFGGRTEFWDHGLESFTLMAGLASVTSRIRLYASTAVLTIPPAIVARMVSTISGGRFGVNIVSGWHKIEYSQMGLWPGDDHFAKRYDYSTEYVTVMGQLWEAGRSDFKGAYFQMDDCRLSPRPVQPVKLVAAGQSDRGMEFAAQFCDFNFALGKV